MIKKIRSAVKNGRMQWQKHAFERMMERSISRESVKNVVKNGSIIEEYREGVPFPTFLIMGWHGKQVLHVVLSYDESVNYCYIITVYKPDLIHFCDDFKTRRK